MAQAPLHEEVERPPLLVPASRELRRFGWSWVVLGLALLAAALASGSTRELDNAELILLAVLLGLSLAFALGALLLARRTGPEILYYRILDRAPAPPPEVPLEKAGATTRRVLPAAVALSLGFVIVAVAAVAIFLTFAGQPRAQLPEDMPGGTLLVAAGWTAVCGVAALRMAAYFAHWERLRDRVILCRPLRAGTMRHVYWVGPRK